MDRMNYADLLNLGSKLTNKNPRHFVSKGLNRNIPTGGILHCASGGGFRMIEQMTGVYQALDELGIKADHTIGASAGGIAAGLYESGNTGKQIEAIIRARPASTLRSFNYGMFIPFCKTPVYNRSGMRDFLTTSIKPCAASKVTVNTTRVCDMESIEMEATPDSLMATSAIPEVFDPQVINGVSYVDGGVLNNIPLPRVVDVTKYDLIIISLCCSGDEASSSAFKITRALNWFETTMLREFFDVQKGWKDCPNVKIIQPPCCPSSSLLDWSKNFTLVEMAKNETLNVMKSWEGVPV